MKTATEDVLRFEEPLPQPLGRPSFDIFGIQIAVWDELIEEMKN